MSQIAHPDVAYVADVLETVGQKYRLQQLARGSLLFIALMFPASLIAGLIAHISGAGAIALIVILVWGILATILGWFWIVKPFFIRPKLQWVARLIESRIDGLNNGLTNAMRLSERDDLQQSNFMPMIYSEIRQTAEKLPIGSAVSMGEIGSLAIKSVIVLLITTVCLLLGWSQISHGWQQMLSPGGFVPSVSSIEILSVTPGDTTIIRGQPLEIVATTSQFKLESIPAATLFLDPPVKGKSQIDLQKMASDRFGARIERLDANQKYRIEVGGTQSRWYEVKVIDQIKLKSLNLSISPTAYTKLKNQLIDVNLESLSPIAIQQGSKVELTARVDIPVSGAMLLLSDQPPAPMRRQVDGTQFVSEFLANHDVSATILLTDGSGQTIARLPEPAIEIKVQQDVAPVISMIYPSADVKLSIGEKATISASLHDDIGLENAKILMGIGAESKLTPMLTVPINGATDYKIEKQLELTKEQLFHGQIIQVQVEATDQRNLPDNQGPQTSRTPVYQIKLEDPSKIAAELKADLDELRKQLQLMLKKQQDLNAVTSKLSDLAQLGAIPQGQKQLQSMVLDVAEKFQFRSEDANVQKTLLMLAKNPAQSAIDLCAAITTEPDPKARIKQHEQLQSQQRVIISTLQSLLSMLVKSEALIEKKSIKGGDLKLAQDEINQLKAALDEYMKQQQKILDQTAPLAKKPVDDFTEQDKKNLEDLAMAQEKLDSFMQEKVSDFSKLAEQDMSNSSLLKELMEVYSEVTMAKDALKKQQTEIAVAAEEMGLEGAKELSSNLEKWLPTTPDRVKWDQEDPLTKTDTPMAELPEQLEDMIGELMEQQEDLLEEAEDTNANWTDSIDKGAGWDALDGPIASMAAKGVTGNNLPNNNEMGGRSGEGRSGKSQGEFVEDTATGKGGRNTPTRLDPTAFQKGQVKDESKDPVGGATGGGKISGQGGEGLEGPVPPAIQQEMKRLAQKQAQIRNAAERLNLQYQLGKYDNFKLLESIAIMRRMEADFAANRYDNAMYRKDVLVENIETSRMLVGGEVQVQHDSSNAISAKLDDQIHDAMKGELPPTWREVLKTYYQKIGQ